MDGDAPWVQTLTMSGPPAADQGRVRVLVVDDNPDLRVVITMLLDMDGRFEVVGEAEDGASALAAVAALRPDVVLLDVQLPALDGFEVAQRLLARSNGCSPAVVLTSSRDGADFGGLVAESGARGFVPKAELSGAALAALLE